MDHKEFVATVSVERLTELKETQDRAGVVHLLGHAGLIVGLGVWIALGLPLWQIALVIQGIALCFLFTLEHEATHKTPFRTLWLNEWVGRVSGFLIFQPFIWFRYFHLAHHRYTNIPDKDPELTAGHKPETKTAYVYHVSGAPYWLGMAQQIVINAKGASFGDFVPNSAKPRIVSEARKSIGLYALAFASLVISPLLFWVWLLPLALGMPFLRLYLLAEHGRCAFVANMFENTRTTFTNRLVRFFAWNMPYHVEHHSIPMVPFHKLPELHKEMHEHLQVTSDGYRSFTAEYVSKLRYRLRVNRLRGNSL